MLYIRITILCEMHEIDKTLHKFSFLCKRNFRMEVREGTSSGS